MSPFRRASVISGLLLSLGAAGACTVPPEVEAREATESAISAPGRTHACFDETGYCVAGPMLASWDKLGGLPSLGLPLSPRRLEPIDDGTSAPVQWFERARLEDHNGVIMLSRLGASAYERASGHGWSAGGGAGEARPDCRFFPETKHYACGEFLGVLDRFGLDRVGFPIAEADGDTQWFERMHLEIHREIADVKSEWRVQGSQIGRSEMAAQSDFSHEPVRPFSGLVGWAYSPRIDLGRAQVAADMRKIKAAGANAIYVSHANPGEVAPDSEPGLTFSLWDAVERNTSQRTLAEQQIQAVMDVVESAEAEGLSIVLAVGYQIELGSGWSDLHDGELRRDADGKAMLTWTDYKAGRTASPYSAIARGDLERYWRWVDATFVRSHANVVALNIGDEPMGADWSAHAKAEFARVYGRRFDDAPADAQGRFLSGVLADWASWAAGTWLRIEPDVHTLMTFHIQRTAPFFPDFERVFADAPRSFVFSADTHLHDAPPGVPATDASLLYAQARTLGWLSNVYKKPLMLWSSANDWGLGCDRGKATCKYSVEDAGRNVDLVVDTAREVGGDTGMVMAFGYNQRYLGAFGPTPDARVYDPEALFSRVTSALVGARDRLGARGNTVPTGVVVTHEDVDRYAAVRLPVIQRVSPGTGHITEEVIDLERFRDVLQSRGVELLSGHAASVIRARGGAIEAAEWK